MSKRMIHNGLKVPSIALLALTATLAGCGGGSDSASSGDTGGGGTVSGSALPVFPSVTSCAQQTGVASPLQTNLSQITTDLQTGTGGTGAAGLSSVLSSLLNVNDLLTSGLQSVAGGANASTFASSLSSSASSLTCSLQLLSNTLTQIAAMGNLPTGATSSFGPTGTEITSLLSTLSGIMTQSQTGSGVNLGMLMTQLQSLSSDLTTLAPQLPGASTTGLPTSTLLSALGGNFGNLTQIFGQLGDLNSTGLKAALPTQLSDLTTLLSTSDASSLGLLPAQLAPSASSLTSVLGSQQTILTQLFSLTSLLSGTGLSSILGPLLG